MFCPWNENFLSLAKVFKFPRLIERKTILDFCANSQYAWNHFPRVFKMSSGEFQIAYNQLYCLLVLTWENQKQDINFEHWNKPVMAKSVAVLDKTEDLRGCPLISLVEEWVLMHYFKEEFSLCFKTNLKQLKDLLLSLACHLIYIWFLEDLKLIAYLLSYHISFCFCLITFV